MIKKTLAIAGLTILLVGLCPTPIRAQSYEDCIKSGKYLAGYPRDLRMAFSSFDDAVKECMKRRFLFIYIEYFDMVSKKVIFYRFAFF